MEVEIGQFRNLYERKFQFFEGLNLLSGLNGKGKSNTFSAIEWCLYGSCAGGSILPRGRKKASVTLRFLPFTDKDGITKGNDKQKLEITRKKGTELLKLYKDGIEYTDKEASELIKGLFGTYEVWRVSCSIPQEARCQLFTGTKEQQMNALNTIIFSNSDPVEIQKKIESKRKTEEQEMKCLRAKLEGMRLGLEQITDEDLLRLSSSQIDKMCQILLEQILSMEESEKKRIQLVAQIQILERQRLALEKELSEIPLPFQTSKDAENFILEKEKDLSVKREFYSKLKSLIETKKKYELLEKQLLDLGFTLQTTFSLKDEDEETYRELQRKEFVYSANVEKCLKLKIEYDREKIEGRKNELEQFLLICPKLHEKQKLLETLEWLKPSIQQVPNFQEDKAEELRKLDLEIGLCEKNKGLMSCPKCKTPLKISFGTNGTDNNQTNLICAEGFVVDKNKLEELKEKRREVNSYQVKREEVLKNMLHAKEVMLSLSLLTETTASQNIDYLKLERESNHFLTLLREISWVEKPPSSNEYYKRLTGSKIQKELFLLPPIPPIPLDVNNGLQEIEKLEKEIYYTKLNKQRKEECLERLRKISESIPITTGLAIEDSSVNLLMAKQTLENFKVKRDEVKKREESLEKINILKGVENEAKDKETYLSRIEKLKDICRTVQSERIDSSLDTLNFVANEILKEMFDEPMSVEIKAIKETKQGKIKNELDIVIQHNSEELHSLRPDLSVGQANRVSMAVNMSLFLLTPCPFILMDEPFAPVDTFMIDKSLEALKEFLPKGRMCIISAHAHNGFFDHEVNLK